MTTDSNGKLSTLPQLHRFVTGHNDSGQAIVQTENDFQWQPYDDKNMAFSILYTTSAMPADLNNDKDLSTHQELMASGKLGLVNPSGSVIRCVDFAPGYSCAMHRTQSLDFGIVLEGEIEMLLDSGEKHQMKRGDVAVQRATQHQWRNKSSTGKYNNHLGNEYEKCHKTDFARYRMGAHDVRATGMLVVAIYLLLHTKALRTSNHCR